jgi:thiamine transport system substrate-binding protein
MSKADVVVGLDDRLIGSRDAEVLFDDSGISIETTNLPYKAFKATKFIPFDYGFLAFMFNTKAKTPAGKPFAKPDSMEALLTNQDLRRSILIQDPRTSAPGMGLLLWLRSIYGSNTPKKLKELHQQTLSVSRGWSESYGFFTKGEAPLVLSYTTSEAYHRDAEKTDHYVALSFRGTIPPWKPRPSSRTPAIKT